MVYSVKKLNSIRDDHKQEFNGMNRNFTWRKTINELEKENKTKQIKSGRLKRSQLKKHSSFYVNVFSARSLENH